MNKRHEKIKNEHSKRVFWVIQTIFSFVIANSFIEYKTVLLNPVANWFQALLLLFVYTTVLLSWIDYSASTVYSPYNFSKNRERFRFLLDIVIVITYIYMLFFIEKITSVTSNLSPILLTIIVTFHLYLVVGLLRIVEHGPKASKYGIIISFLLIYASIYRIYVSIPITRTSNTIFMILIILTMVTYRLIRAHANRKKPWIGVDVDGVLADQITNLLPIIERKYQKKLNYSDVVYWDFPISNTGLCAIIKEEQQHKQYLLSMNTYHEAVKYINKLRKNFKIAIITARSPETDSFTQEWLKNNSIVYDAYYNQKEGNKHNIDLNYSILIDDNPCNIMKYLEYSTGKAILFSQPWNKELSEEMHKEIINKRLYISSDWNEVYNIITKLNY